jgi:hypothetical protein
MTLNHRTAASPAQTDSSFCSRLCLQAWSERNPVEVSLTPPYLLWYSIMRAPTSPAPVL